jgi:DNA-binding FrmR family transcriptional regulator
MPPTKRILKYTPMGYICSGMTHRPNKQQLLNRLNRALGQVQGIARMIEQDRYCIDVVTQIQAVRAALIRVEAEMMRDHISHCVKSAMEGDDRDDQQRKLDELVSVLTRSVR